MAGMVCTCPLDRRTKKSFLKKRFLSGSVCRTCPLPYFGILAGVYHENVRQPSSIRVRGDSVAVIVIFGALLWNLFICVNLVVQKAVDLFVHDSFDMGFIGIHSYISFHRIPLGADWVHTIKRTAYDSDFRYVRCVRRIVLHYLKQCSIFS